MDTPQLIKIKTNFFKLSLLKIDVWFSYATPVAYRIDGGGLIVRDVFYSKTTSGHVNSISAPARSTRVPEAVFLRNLDAALHGRCYHIIRGRAFCATPAPGWTWVVHEVMSMPNEYIGVVSTDDTMHYRASPLRGKLSQGVFTSLAGAVSGLANHYLEERDG